MKIVVIATPHTTHLALAKQVAAAGKHIYLEKPMALDVNECDEIIAACRAGDVKAVERMFTEDVEVHSDGGGKVGAARVVVRGRDRAARFLAGVFSKKYGALEMHAVRVNSAPGVVFTSGGAAIQVVALCIAGGVRAVYMTNNPDKVARWSVAEVE